jgi:hypothetical protein
MIEVLSLFEPNGNIKDSGAALEVTVATHLGFQMPQISSQVQNWVQNAETSISKVRSPVKFFARSNTASEHASVPQLPQQYASTWNGLLNKVKLFSDLMDSVSEVPVSNLSHCLRNEFFTLPFRYV